MTRVFAAHYIREEDGQLPDTIVMEKTVSCHFKVSHILKPKMYVLFYFALVRNLNVMLTFNRHRCTLTGIFLTL